MSFTIRLSTALLFLILSVHAYGFEIDGKFSRDKKSSDHEDKPFILLHTGEKIPCTKVRLHKNDYKVTVIGNTGVRNIPLENIRADTLPPDTRSQIQDRLQKIRNKASREWQYGAPARARELFNKVYKYRAFLSEDTRKQLLKTITLQDGTTEKYFTFNVLRSDTAVQILTRYEDRSFSWDQLNPEKTPANIKSKIRDALQDNFAKAEELHQSGNHQHAADYYRIVRNCLGFLKPEERNRYKTAGIKHKAQGKLKYKGEWLTFSQIQRQKGLVYYQGDWVTPEKREELKTKKTIQRLLEDKSKPNTRFKVLQVFKKGDYKGYLAQIGERIGNRTFYNGSVFFLAGTTDPLARGDKKQMDLYWWGTVTYRTQAGGNRTVNCYAPTREIAFAVLEKRFKGPPKARDQQEKDTQTTHRTPISQGTGFFITPDGYMLTNRHVIKGADEIVIKQQEKRFAAQVAAVDKDIDLALLKAEGRHDYLKFTERNSLSLGDSIFTIGFPMVQIQGFSPKVTDGIISSLTGMNDKDAFYQIDAAVQPGNSGGPLLDKSGHVAGVVTASLNDQKVLTSTGNIPENVNYAIKKRHAIQLLKNHQEAAQKIKSSAPEDVDFQAAVKNARKAVALVQTFSESD